ncbi:MAG TPA: di-heme oxidoredictase family protein, partial [Verrucomicrobiales bacterium]|nr:di-heme oxidoredictase family protein [Verrucomicrobiales bacterium]
LFNENWVAAPGSAKARDGLGPLFHARSCSSCHELDGRGQPPAPGEVMTSLLLRLSIPGTSEHGGPLPDPVYGGQLAPRALPGLLPEAVVTMEEKEVAGTFPDGTSYVLKQPVYSVQKWNYGAPSPGLMLSPRVAPAVFGLGLLEAVPEDRILRLADPDDADGDGISGRANEVWNPETGSMMLGRFGWKANTATLRQQSADAALNDMGLTSPLAATENHTVLEPQAAHYPSGGEKGGPEITAPMLNQIVVYVKTLAPPARRSALDLSVRAGQRLFHSIGCAACHRATLSTGTGPEILPELAGQNIHPYTDLLLHDMGPGLADGRPDFAASGSEWRTTPLWGLGLQMTVNGHDRLLHDGRARGIGEAILWHGGEAQPSRDAWMALTKEDREKVVKFLQSL